MSEQSTSNATPVSAPEGHDAAMIAAFDKTQGQQTSEAANASSERPAGLPEKFGSWEDMAKAYAELERKQSQGNQTPTETELPASTEEAKQLAESAGLDFNALSAEYAQSGTLSEASYAAIAKAGFPKEAVDQFIAGQEAIAQQNISSMKAEFGGEDGYGQMVEWAAANLDPAAIQAFNRTMDSGDMDSIRLAITGLQAKYTAANGKEPNLINGGNSDGQEDVFRSTAEMTAAMKDPRYAKDKAYQAEVHAKVARSSIF